MARQMLAHEMHLTRIAYEMLMKCISSISSDDVVTRKGHAWEMETADEASAAANIDRIDASSFFSSCVILPNKG